MKAPSSPSLGVCVGGSSFSSEVKMNDLIPPQKKVSFTGPACLEDNFNVMQATVLVAR